MTKRLSDEYDDSPNRIAKALEGIESAMHDINDTNILHLQAINNNTKAVENIEKYWGKIVFVLTIAIIALAGFEKIGKLLGL